MKIKISKLYLLAFAAIAFMLTNCSKENEPLTFEDEPNLAAEFKASESNPSANGHGTLYFEDATREFTFHAKMKPDGSVNGSGILTWSDGELVVKFSIDCLNILEDDMTAIMSGIVTSHSTDPEVVGRNCWFKVIDNGKGSNADPDEISLFYWYPPDEQASQDCYTDNAVNMFQIAGGNIQVKP
jgi:hypothetical protein